MNPQQFGSDLAFLRKTNRIRQFFLASQLGVAKERIEGVEQGTCCITKSQLELYLRLCGGQEGDIEEWWGKMLDVRNHVEWVLYGNVSKAVADKVMELFWKLEPEKAGDLVAATADQGLG